MVSSQAFEAICRDCDQKIAVLNVRQYAQAGDKIIDK